MEKNISVVILDDQLVQREGIARVINDSGSMHVVFATGSSEEAFSSYMLNTSTWHSSTWF